VSAEPDPAEALSRWRALLAKAGGGGPLPVERVAPAAAAGRVLAEDVAALRASPPLRVAAMDGIAVRAADTGSAPVLLAGGDAVPVDTGAPIPDGFDAVVVRERVTVDGAGFHVQEAVEAGRHVRPAGEDIPVGVDLLPAGRVLSAFDVALLAAAGHAEIPVRVRPRVAVIPTGDELRSVGEPLDAHHVLDSNGPMLVAQAAADGALAGLRPRVPDDPDALGDALLGAAAEADLVLLVAGSSRGRRDHSRDVIARLGRIAVDGVAVRPGHPVLLGAVGAVPVVGVPGYPVSAAFTYELLAREVLGDLAGGVPPRMEVEARAAEPIGGRDDATCVVAVRLEPVPGELPLAHPQARRAGALRALAGADGYAVIPPGPGPRVGDVVAVRRL
jgi:putative molybdopterin biosynthesis protein